MTTTETPAKCREVDDHMSDVIEGVAENAVFDHMAACVRCRNARHDAEQVLLRVAEAAADYQLPEDLSARVMSALDARRPSLIPAAVGEKLSTLRGLLARRSKGPGGSALLPSPSLLSPSLRRLAPPGAGTDGALMRTRWAWLSLAAAVGLAVLWVGSRRAPGEAPPSAHPGNAGAWQGQVVQVERAFGSPSGLIECARGTQLCHPLSPGDLARAGMRLETDGLTRALVRFADGSRVFLDRQSRFELDPDEPRRGRLLEGNVVAEIGRLVDDPPANGGADAAERASILVPQGRVEVMGTKFSLRAGAGSARVEVSRGSVKLTDTRGQSVQVQAGEAGVIGEERTPRVESVVALGQALGWSTSAFQQKGEPEEHGALGELIAKRPRDGQELPGAVLLGEHRIRVRIVDNIARTEVEEVFENQADEVLEGIYRFPLPPGAQIERLALEVDGKLQEGAFVDRQRAAAIWRGAVVNAGGKTPPPSEDIVWVPGPWRDPALLEWQRGSRFELRIFPIPARGSRRVVLAYTEVLPPSEGRRTYVYPLPRDARGNTRIARFSAEVEVRGLSVASGVEARGYPLETLSGAPEVARLAYEAKDFVPSGDLSIAYELASPDAELRTWVYRPKPGEHEPPGLAGGPAQDRPVGSVPGGSLPGKDLPDPAPASSSVSDREAGVAPDTPFVAMALKPSLPRRTRAEPRDYVLVADTSRSMIGESHRRAISVITHIIREMDRSDRVALLACDASCRALSGGYSRPGDATADAATRFLEGIEPEGASDLGFAVEQAAAVRDAKPDNRGEPPADGRAERSLRVIYVGDGTPTVGPIHPALLERAIAEALPRGASLSAVAVGNDADRATLRVATRAGGGISVAFTPGQSPEDVAYAVLGATYGHALANARLELPDGMLGVMPAHVGSIAAGAEALVVARLTQARVQGDVVLRGEVAGEAFERRFTVELVAEPGEANAFVPRLYASVAIAELEASMDEGARRRSIELSTRYNVASRYTSLLVLESPAMFAAFGLDNRRGAPEWTGELESQKSESAGAMAELEEALGDASSDGSVGRGARGSSASSARAARPPESSGAPDADSSGERMRSRPSESPRQAAPGDARTPADPVPQAAPAPSSQPTGPDDNPYTDSEPTARSAPNDERDEPSPDREERTEAETERGLPRQPLELPEQRLIPMRQVWDRVARIDAPARLLSATAPERRQSLELRARANAESRDALRNLYVVDFLAEDLESATRVAERWSEKDPLDVDALTARADLAAQRGDRELAIRILGSVVDVRPGDYKAQWRLARLHRWAGHPERGCRHSLGVAQLMLRDARLVSEAVGCARDVGLERVADDLLAALEPNVRREVLGLVLQRRPSDALSGDFRVLASWQGAEHDVDVAILDPEGYRISWLGAPTRAVITANDVLSVQREGLALRGAPPGQYAIEVTRSSSARGAIRGNLLLSIANSERNVPFLIEGERTRVATVTLRNEARLVPLHGSE